MRGAALAIPAAAAAAYFLFAGKSKAATPKPKPVPSPTTMPVPERMARVLATRNPAAIRFEAGRLRQEGYPNEAAELERAAAAIEAGQVTPPTPAPVLPIPVPVPVVTQVPGLPPIVAPTPVPTSPATVAIPGAPWLSGVPAQLQGVVLRKVPPPAPYDARVLLVQQRLLALGYKLPSGADGKFGSETEAAVKAFQLSNRVTPVDGIVGPATLSALASPTAKGPSASVKPPAATPIVVKPPVATPAPVKPPIPLPAGPAPAPASSTGTAPTITPSLRSLPALLRNGKPTYKAPASSGQAVKDWQQVLFDLGFLKAKPDGKFGDGTEAATRAFQTAANSAAAKSGKPKLTVDGIVGPATVKRAAEARIMRSGPATFTGDSYFGDDVMFAPSMPLADSPLPGFVPPMQPSGPDPARALASRLLHNLVSSPAGREDRMLVQLFQQQEGLRPTGYYGPATALVLAQRYGIVPPKPIHWTESRTSRSKANYRDALRMLGERDPQRAEEWFRASEV